MAWIRRSGYLMFLLFFLNVCSLLPVLQRENHCWLWSCSLLFFHYRYIWLWDGRLLRAVQQGLAFLLCKNFAQAGQINLLTLLPSFVPKHIWHYYHAFISKDAVFISTLLFSLKKCRYKATWSLVFIDFWIPFMVSNAALIWLYICCMCI